MARPFMTTPRQLASLEGQQYLVLRPRADVADRYASEQRDALALAGLPHPHTGHVTLRGFYEPERREELADLLRTWAAAQPAMEVVAEAVDVFPDPWQILILRLARTHSLVSAYATLTQALEATDFRRLGESPLEDWTFHLSVVYGKELPGEAWAAIESTRVQEFAHPLREVMTEVEFVSYSGGQEHREVIPFGLA